MLIEIMQEDIDNGTKRNSYDCPIGLATNRKLGYTKVNHYQLYLITTGKYIKLPQEVTKFIFDFDKGQEVEPFSFNIET